MRKIYCSMVCKYIKSTYIYLQLIQCCLSVISQLKSEKKLLFLLTSYHIQHAVLLFGFLCVCRVFFSYYLNPSWSSELTVIFFSFCLHENQSGNGMNEMFLFLHFWRIFSVDIEWLMGHFVCVCFHQFKYIIAYLLSCTFSDEMSTVSLMFASTSCVWPICCFWSLSHSIEAFVVVV